MTNDTIEITCPQDQAKLRKLALAAQGLLSAQPFGQGLAGARKAINHIGYVQIDTISVVERAHSHVLYVRVPKFKPAMINTLLQGADIFEYWTHAAAFIPINDFRFSIPYKSAIKNGKVHWYKNPDKKLMAALLDRIRIDGPLRSRDLESGAIKRTGWWDLKPAKKALEQLYMEGDLMVSRREGFEKVYDLSERVLPSHIDTRSPDSEAFAQHLLAQQLRCHGLVSLKGLTYLRKNAALRRAVKTLIEDKIQQGCLQPVQVISGERFYLPAGALDRAAPRLGKRMLILSPFDNSVIQRDRLKALFNFDYQIECYVPEAKRKFGYFSLPLLYCGEFVGRMDCKAHRKDGHLEVKSLHFEPHGFEDDAICEAFVTSMAKFCEFQQCHRVSLTCVHPKRLASSLRQQLKAIANTLGV